MHRSSKERQKTDSIIPKVHCPKFSKIKDEGWFLILGDPSQAELLALKRCSYRNTKSIQPITFTAPNKLGNYQNSTFICEITWFSRIFFCLFSIFRSILVYALYYFRQLYRIRSTIRYSIRSNGRSKEKQ